jgi:hypothetical protein
MLSGQSTSYRETAYREIAENFAASPNFERREVSYESEVFPRASLRDMPRVIRILTARLPGRQ